MDEPRMDRPAQDPDLAPDVPLCASDAVPEGGRGVRFPVLAFGEAATGFVVRFQGQVYAYLNRCAHVPIELDWAEGEFFESSGLYLMCSTHGAIYVPESGQCAGGPCKGGRLRPIAVREAGSQIYWQPDEFIKPPPNPTNNK
jgi:nitrite reductase/ring-hydroxylating ferredoxin subunit